MKFEANEDINSFVAAPEETIKVLLYKDLSSSVGGRGRRDVPGKWSRNSLVAEKKSLNMKLRSSRRGAEAKVASRVEPRTRSGPKCIKFRTYCFSKICFLIKNSWKHDIFSLARELNCSDMSSIRTQIY